MKICFRTTLIGVALALAGCSDDKQQMTTASSTNNPSSASEGGSSTGAPTDTTGGGTTGGGTEAVTTSASGTSGTDSCSFLGCGGSSSGGSVNECDIWKQDCPEGQKCMPWANDGGGSWNATKCSPVNANPGKEGDPCTVEGSAVSGIDSCDVGLLCWYFNENNEGTCIDMCTGSQENPQCDDGQVCDITNDGVLILCLTECDPLIQSCPMGQICFFSSASSTFICDFDASGDMGAYGDPCAYINVCDYGLFCATQEAVPGCDNPDGCCSPYCNLMDANNCPGAAMGQECVPWYEMGQAPPGQENIGACAVPA